MEDHKYKEQVDTATKEFKDTLETKIKEQG